MALDFSILSLLVLQEGEVQPFLVLTLFPLQRPRYHRLPPEV